MRTPEQGGVIVTGPRIRWSQVPRVPGPGPKGTRVPVGGPRTEVPGPGGPKGTRGPGPEVSEIPEVPRVQRSRSRRCQRSRRSQGYQGPGPEVSEYLRSQGYPGVSGYLRSQGTGVRRSGGPKGTRVLVPEVPGPMGTRGTRGTGTCRWSGQNKDTITVP
jgi:hypothetical protein